MYPIGETKVITIVGDAGDTVIDFRPPPGYEWIINFVVGYHDDDNALALGWRFNNFGVIGSLDQGRTLAAYHRHVFPSVIINGTVINVSCLPPRFTHDNYLELVTAGLAGDKHLLIDAMVTERPENVELLLREWYADLVGRELPKGLQALRSRIAESRSGV